MNVDHLVQNPQLKHIFSAIDEGVLVLNEELIILLANQTAKNWLEVKEGVKGRPLAKVVSDFQFCRLITNAIRTLSQAFFKGEHPSASGFNENFVIGTQGRAIRLKIIPASTQENELFFIVLMFDMTEMHRLQEMKRDFVANASHELKTPLASIRGYSELIAELPSTQKDSLASHFISVILRNSEQLALMIDDLLMLSKLESGSDSVRFEKMNLSEILERVRETLTPKAERAGVTLTFECPAELILMADPKRLESVFLNLVDNGIKYNKPQGFVKVQAFDNESTVQVIVEDSGMGIPAELQARVFERFYRVDASHSRLGGGTGLGLAIVKHILRAHGGEILLHSIENKGSTFTLMLPKSN